MTSCRTNQNKFKMPSQVNYIKWFYSYKTKLTKYFVIVKKNKYNIILKKNQYLTECIQLRLIVLILIG